MKKILFYGGAFLGSLVLINVGIYFFLNATLPKTAMITEVDSTLHADSLHTDSTFAHVDETDVHADSSTQHGDEHATENELLAIATLPDSMNAETPEIISDETEHPDTQTELEEPIEPELSSEETLEAAMTGDPKQLAKLAKLMDGMKPIDSAAIASRLPVDTIVTLIMKMKDRSAAKMMASLPVDQAARVAIRMSELASRPS